MAQTIQDIFPQILRIGSGKLQSQAETCWLTALQRGGWELSDLERVPFSLASDMKDVSLAAHTRNVTDCSLALGEVLSRAYANVITIDFDILTAGALLHDVGKLLEYTLENGTWRVSQAGRFLRHPISGCALAAELKLPEHVQHIIAVHSHEGDRSPRTPEAWILHHSDFVNFDPFKR